MQHVDDYGLFGVRGRPKPSPAELRAIADRLVERAVDSLTQAHKAAAERAPSPPRRSAQVVLRKARPTLGTWERRGGGRASLDAD